MDGWRPDRFLNHFQSEKSDHEADHDSFRHRGEGDVRFYCRFMWLWSCVFSPWFFWHFWGPKTRPATVHRAPRHLTGSTPGRPLARVVDEELMADWSSCDLKTGQLTPKTRQAAASSGGRELKRPRPLFVFLLRRLTWGEERRGEERRGELLLLRLVGSCC